MSRGENGSGMMRGAESVAAEERTYGAVPWVAHLSQRELGRAEPR
jgi:hypothetical protein